MSTWRKINNDCVDIDDDDIEILIDTDDNGNNYVIVSLTYIMDLVSEIEMKKVRKDN